LFLIRRERLYNTVSLLTVHKIPMKIAAAIEKEFLGKKWANSYGLPGLRRGKGAQCARRKCGYSTDEESPKGPVVMFTGSDRDTGTVSKKKKNGSRARPSRAREAKFHLKARTKLISQIKQ